MTLIVTIVIGLVLFCCPMVLTTGLKCVPGYERLPVSSHAQIFPRKSVRLRVSASSLLAFCQMHHSVQCIGHNIIY